MKIQNKGLKNMTSSAVFQKQGSFLWPYALVSFNFSSKKTKFRDQISSRFMRRSVAAAVHTSRSFQFKNVLNHFDSEKIPYWLILMVIQVGASKIKIGQKCYKHLERLKFPNNFYHWRFRKNTLFFQLSKFN